MMFTCCISCISFSAESLGVSIQQYVDDTETNVYNAMSAADLNAQLALHCITMYWNTQMVLSRWSCS